MGVGVSIAEYRKKFAQQLPQIDVDLIFMTALQKTRAELFALLNNSLLQSEENSIRALIQRRLKGEPIAYLIGTQAFWTMELIVTRDTLIPRPETECLVDWILHHFAQHEKINVADLGTGTGAIAIALALEKKNWHIDATDHSPEALAVAKKNIVKYGAKNVSLYLSNWYENLPKKKYDLIVSNPPYIAQQDPHLKQLRFEPQNALVSGKDGLDAIRYIAHHAKHFLAHEGYLVMEHGFDQAEKVARIFQDAGFVSIKNHRDLSDIPRFVTGKIV